MSSADLESVELDNIKDATLDMNIHVKGRVCKISKGDSCTECALGVFSFNDNAQKR